MKKITNVISKVLLVFVFSVAVLSTIFTVVSVSAVRGDDRYFLDWRVYTVLSDSMSKTDFCAGDLIFVQRVTEPEELKTGDIISYISKDGASYGKTVTHKIRKILADSKGKISFVTYGTTTDTDDETPVLFTDVVGKYRFSIADAGNFFSYLKTFEGYFFCIFMPFAIVITMQLINCIKLFKAYKKECVTSLVAL